MALDMLMDVKTTFLNALDKGTRDEREAYLDTACADDSDLREQVDRLLDAHESARGFLDPEIFASDTPVPPESVDFSGSVVGRYHLLEKIGEGGMAVVYRAEQEQPIRRQVAIKVIKLGMDTKEVIARFEAERQVLALMEHPNIAKVLDAGATEAGKPYFVMELVQGVSITDYCDENRLSTGDRLKLFVPVCDAVHHAHQKGIIHRDLKPSNILVAQRDGKPVPMIIDFGIAKAVTQRLSGKTRLTLHTQLVGTPEYMSPEQADTGDSDIDTRTDIYSLGVVLYELLAGTPPFDTATLRHAAIGEIQRIIREEEPLRPSTRIGAMGDAAKEIAARRSTHVADLAKRLTRELEWIPLMALRKDRARRYRSASEFGDDIHNYLNERPLVAGPESVIYRFRKTVRKHRISAMAITAAAVALIAGFAISTLLYVNMRQALDVASKLKIQAEVDRILDTAQKLRVKGQCRAALEEIGAQPEETQSLYPIRLMKAQLQVDLGQFDPAEDELLQLTQTHSEPQIAGVAHSLLARIFLTINPARANKHRQQAESILPQTAEDFYLRGMFAASAKDALKWLSKAVEKDIAHYSARKARAFACYKLKAYRDMERDANVLVELRSRDYMGYALRGIARRETGQYALALEDHAKAIDLCNDKDELIRLYEQRQVTHIRRGEYRQALEDAEQVEVLKNDGPEFPLLDALMPLGDYERIEAEHKEVSALHPRVARFAKVSAESYVFDLQERGQSLVLPADIAAESPFYLMEQAANLYEWLKTRATPLPISGGSWLGDWSPDGRYIAYRHFSAYGWLPDTLEGIKPNRVTSSIEILDLLSGETRLIARFGNGPMWSPDDQHIVFVDYSNKEGPELWLISSAGGEPQKLAQGARPQWSGDSRCVFFRGYDGRVWSIDIVSREASPVPGLKGYSGTYLQSFRLSPDERMIADQNLGEILVRTFPEGEELVRWKMPWPLQIWAGQLRWHPGGKTLVFNSSAQYNQMGMCLFDVEQGETRHVINVTRPWCRTIWSPDGSQLIIQPYSQDQVWIMSIDPAQSLEEALSPALSTAAFVSRRLEKWDQRIVADPLYADNYVSRAVVLMAANDLDRAEQDLNHCFTLIDVPNDPAVGAIHHWASMYQSAGREVEAQLWNALMTQLIEKFPVALAPLQSTD